MSTSGVAGFDPLRLRAARQQSGLSQRELAERLAGDHPTKLPQLTELARKIETARTQVHYYETGQRVPRADMLHQLGRALNIDPLALLHPTTPLKLATLRSRHGLLQADIAKHLSCGRAYYGRIETGTAKINTEDRRRLAAVLKINAEQVNQAIAGTTTVGALLERTSTRGRPSE